jgi:hypothetical protein
MVQMLAVQMVTGLLLPTRYVQRCPAPRCQFKMPDIFNQPDAESPPPSSPPPSSPLRKSANPFASFIEAFTPVEVDRDGNVVPNAPLPTLFGNSKPPSEATTDADDERAKQRIAAIDAGEKDVGEKATCRARTDGMVLQDRGLCLGAPTTRMRVMLCVFILSCSTSSLAHRSRARSPAWHAPLALQTLTQRPRRRRDCGAPTHGQAAAGPACCERLCYWRRHGWVFGTAVCCASQRGL